MDDKIKDFLLKEYDYNATLFQYNEEVGEKRLTYFNTLATAVIGGVIALLTKISDLDALYTNFIYFMVIVSLIGLWFTGLITINRLNKRNIKTKETKDRLCAIREKYVQYCELNESFLDYWDQEKEDKGFFTFTSLSNIAIILNSFILTLTITVILFAKQRDFIYPRDMVISGSVGLIVMVYHFYKRPIWK